ncbi:MAG: C-GCAxxG-C-C family protein [Clostridia bacterium]
MTRQEKARELFLKGYNCSQSVFTAFCDKFDLDEETALKISAGLGGGVGRQREVCGCVSGAAMALGSVAAGTKEGDDKAKMKNYALVGEFCDKFKAAHSTIICKELLLNSGETLFGTNPDPKTYEFYKDRPCLVLVENAVKILEEFYD